MTIRAQLPDGNIMEFPDGIDPGVMQRSVKKYMGLPFEEPKAPKPEASVLGELSSGLVRAGRGFVSGTLHHPADLVMQKLADATGNQALRDMAASDAAATKAFDDETARSNAPAVPNFTDANTASDYAKWAAGHLGGVPVMGAQAVLTGLPGMVAAGGVSGFTSGYERTGSVPAALAGGAAEGAVMAAPLPLARGASGLVSAALRTGAGMSAVSALNPFIHALPEAVAQGSLAPFEHITGKDILNAAAAGGVSGLGFGAGHHMLAGKPPAVVEDPKAPPVADPTAAPAPAAAPEGRVIVRHPETGEVLGETTVTGFRGQGDAARVVFADTVAGSRNPLLSEVVLEPVGAPKAEAAPPAEERADTPAGSPELASPEAKPLASEEAPQAPLAPSALQPGEISSPPAPVPKAESPAITHGVFEVAGLSPHQTRVVAQRVRDAAEPVFGRPVGGQGARLELKGATPAEDQALADILHRETQAALDRSAKASAGAKTKTPTDFAQWLAKQGGVSGVDADLNSMDADAWTQRNPGWGKLIKPSAKGQNDMLGAPRDANGIDYVLTRAIEQGWLPEGSDANALFAKLSDAMAGREGGRHPEAAPRQKEPPAQPSASDAKKMEYDALARRANQIGIAHDLSWDAADLLIAIHEHEAQHGDRNTPEIHDAEWAAMFRGTPLEGVLARDPDFDIPFPDGRHDRKAGTEQAPVGEAGGVPLDGAGAEGPKAPGGRDSGAEADHPPAQEASPGDLWQLDAEARAQREADRQSAKAEFKGKLPEVLLSPEAKAHISKLRKEAEVASRAADGYEAGLAKYEGKALSLDPAQDAKDRAEAVKARDHYRRLAARLREQADRIDEFQRSTAAAERDAWLESLAQRYDASSDGSRYQNELGQRVREKKGAEPPKFNFGAQKDATVERRLAFEREMEEKVISGHEKTFREKTKAPDAPARYAPKGVETMFRDEDPDGAKHRAEILRLPTDLKARVDLAYNELGQKLAGLGYGEDYAGHMVPEGRELSGLRIDLAMQAGQYARDYIRQLEGKKFSPDRQARRMDALNETVAKVMGEPAPEKTAPPMVPKAKPEPAQKDLLAGPSKKFGVDAAPDVIGLDGELGSAKQHRMFGGEAMSTPPARGNAPQRAMDEGLFAGPEKPKAPDAQQLDVFASKKPEPSNVLPKATEPGNELPHQRLARLYSEARAEAASRYAQPGIRSAFVNAASEAHGLKADKSRESFGRKGREAWDAGVEYARQKEDHAARETEAKKIEAMDLAGLNAELAKLDQVDDARRLDDDVYHRSGAVTEALAAKLAEEPGGIVLEQPGGKMGAMITPEPDGSGKWRISWFDERGFSGDGRRGSKESAVKEALNEGYRDTNRNLLREMATLDSFQKGNEFTDKIRAENEALTREAGDAPSFAKRDSEPTDPQDHAASEAGVRDEVRDVSDGGREDLGLVFSDALADQRRALASTVRRYLDKYGLTDIGARVADQVLHGEADGVFWKKIIHIALDAKDHIAAIDHEAIHALRKLGLFSDKEWSLLVEKAQTLRSGIDATYRADFERRFPEDTARQEAALNEEAVAGLFAARTPAEGFLNRMRARVEAIFEAIKNGFAGKGFRSTDGIFRDIETGKLGGRARAAGGEAYDPNHTPKYSLSEKVADGTASQEAAIKRVIGVTKNKTFVDKVKSALPYLFKQGGIRYELVDFLEPWKQAEIKRDGSLGEGQMSAYKTASIVASNSSSFVETALYGGMVRFGADGIEYVRKGDAEYNPRFEGGYMGILSQLVKGGVNHSKLFGAWKTGLRAQQLMKEGRENLLTQAEIDDLIKIGGHVDPNTGVVTPGAHEWFQQIDKDLNDFRVGVLKFAHDAGLLSQKQLQVLSDTLDYVPFNRILDDRIGGSGAGKSSLTGQSSGIRNLKGGLDKINDPVENLLNNITSLLTRSLRNHAGQRLMELAVDLGYARKIPWGGHAFKTSPEALQKHLEDIGVMMPSLTPQQKAEIISMWHPDPPKGDNIFSVVRAGKAEYYRIDPKHEMMIESLARLPGEQLGPILKIFNTAKQALTGAVANEPGFMLANMIRDTAEVSMLAGVKGFVPLLDTVRGVRKVLANDETKWRMLGSGGAPSSYHGMERGEAPDMVGRANRELAGGGLRHSFDRLLSGYLAVARASELGTRVGAFDKAIKSGDSPSEAAYKSLMILNFGRRGANQGLNTLLAAMPFLNARLQGLDNIARAVQRDPKRLMLMGAMMSTASLALLANNYDDKDYWAIPDWQRDTNWIIKVGGKFHMIPKPFEMGAVFGTMAERLATNMIGQITGNSKEPKGKVAASFFRFVEDTLAITWPQLVKPAVELAGNKVGFSGASIVPEHLKKLKPSEQWDAVTSDTAIAAAKGINAATDKIDKTLGTDIGGVSPKQMEYLVRAYFGQMGMYLLEGSDALVRAATGAPAKPNQRSDEVPVLRRFVRDPDAARSTQYLIDFHKTRRQIEELANTVSRLKKLPGHQAEALAYQQENQALLSIKSYMDNANKQMAQANAMEQAVRLDAAMPGDEKRRRVDEIKRTRNAVVQTATETARKHLEKE